MYFSYGYVEREIFIAFYLFPFRVYQMKDHITNVF